MADTVHPQLETQRDLPSQTADSVLAPQRGSRYGEALGLSVLGSKLVMLADEGSYFHFANATPGTGIAGHAAPTDITSVLKAYFQLRNDAAASDKKRIYLDFLKLQVTVAGAGATSESYAAEIDSGATRRTSGGTELTEVNPNMASSAAATITAYAGAVVTAAATSVARKLGSGLIRSVVPVVGDSFLFTFGDSQRDMSSMIVAGTAIANIKIPLPPVVLGPADQFLLHLAGAGQSGAHSYEVTGGFWYR